MFRGAPSCSRALPNYLPLCRFPHCNRRVFYDSSISEMREWCSYGHMRDAIANKVEKPCEQCQVWPRQKRSKYCSGNLCRYAEV
ncbi:hypothetical protein BC826DRAFT_1061685, partial [Russula brevipes]